MATTVNTEISKNWPVADLQQITTTEKQDEQIHEFTSKARMERFKAVATLTTTITAGFFLAGVSVTIVTNLLFCNVILLLDVAMSDFAVSMVPLMSSVIFTNAFSVAMTYFGLEAVKKFGSEFCEQALMHWNHANHFYDQAEKIQKLQF